MVPVGWGAELAWRAFVPVLVGCGVPCPRVGEGGAVRYDGVVLCGGLPVLGGGYRVQVWWGGLSPVVCPLAVAWGLGSPGAGCAGLECRNQGGVVVWCLGVSANR